MCNFVEMQGRPVPVLRDIAPLSAALVILGLLTFAPPAASDPAPPLDAQLEVENPAGGRLSELSYESATFGPIDLLVYTPPGYFSPGSSESYPVVYWLHGSGGSHLDLIPPLAALPAEGRTAASKLDALIASEQIVPLLMVAVRAPGGSWDDSLTSLVTEQVPGFIDRTFRTVARRGGRGLEGFSLGSEGVSRYVTARPDVFATASLLGGGFLPARWIDRQTEILRDKVEVAQFVGTADGFLGDAQALAQQLDALSVPNELTELPGVVHSAPQIYGSGGIANLQFHGRVWRRAQVVDAGPDQALDAPFPQSVSLAGVLRDPEGLLGGGVTTRWEQVSGPAAAVFADASSLATSVSLTAAGTYHLQLVAEGGSAELCDGVRLIAIDTADGLELHLTFDQGDGADASGNGREGTLSGSPAAVADGRLGGALGFDGVDDAVIVGDFPYGPSWSLALWVRAADLAGSGYQYVASHNGFDLQPSFNFYLPESTATLRDEGDGDEFLVAAPGALLGAGERVRAAVRDGDDPGGQFTTAPAPLNDGAWHHLLLTLPEGGGHEIFVDGELLASNSHGGDPFDPPGDLFFGTRSVSPTGRYFEGDLDDVRLYGRELLDEEIRDLARRTDADSLPTVEAGDDATVYLSGGAVLVGAVVDDLGASSLWTQES
ncbi:MAG: LamG-like jellyroll fold domain-containing protein, partial [Acidobacteriota bacterium]